MSVTKFFQEVSARLKGDDQKALALKIERKALSAINSNLASLKAKLVDDETVVEEAQENLKKAFFPTEVFTDNKAYIEGIKVAQERLDAAEAELESTQATIAYLEGKLAEFFN